MEKAEKAKPGPKPKLKPEEKRITKSVTLPAKTWRQITEKADSMGISRSQYILQAIEHYNTMGQ